MRLDFVKLPNQLFYGKGEKESYIKECGDFNIITTMIYLYSSNDYFGNSVFTIEDLILFTGAKSIERHKGENLDRMRNLLQYMIDKELICCDVDVMKVKSTKIIKCKTNFFDSVDDNGEPYEYGFVKVPVEVIDKLLAYSGKKDKMRLLFYWSYIHCRRYKKQKDSYREVHESCTWVSFDKIEDDLGFGRTTIDNYNKILVELGLLLIHNSGYLVKGKEVKSANNIYVTVDEDLETAEMYMKESISRYEYKRRQEGYRISKCSPEEKKAKKEAKKQLEEACIEEDINNTIINNIPIVEEPIPEEEDTSKPITEDNYTTFYICDDIPINAYTDGHNEIVIGNYTVDFEGDNILDGLFDIKYWSDICVDRVANDNISDKDVISLKREIERYRTVMKIFAMELTRQNIILNEEVLSDIYDDIDDVISRHKKS